MNGLAFNQQLVELATDIGRLRRHTEPDSYDAHLVDRVAGRVQDLHWMLWPTAGELVRHGDTVEAALAHVDARHRQLAGLLGEKPR